MSDLMKPYISHDVRKGEKSCGHHPGQAMVPDRLVAPQQIECLHVKQQMHCNEVVQAVWGETEMQDGNRLEAVRQERICQRKWRPLFSAKENEEFARQCAVSDAKSQDSCRFSRIHRHLPQKRHRTSSPPRRGTALGPRRSSARRLHVVESPGRTKPSRYPHKMCEPRNPGSPFEDAQPTPSERASCNCPAGTVAWRRSSPATHRATGISNSPVDCTDNGSNRTRGDSLCSTASTKLLQSSWVSHSSKAREMVHLTKPTTKISRMAPVPLTTDSLDQ